MAVNGAKDEITRVVLTWDGMAAAPHRFGGTEYRLGTREIGHIHGDHMLDIPFPKKVRDDVVAAGRAEPHHLLPETGWISFYLGSRLTLIERSPCWPTHTRSRGSKKADERLRHKT